MSNATATEKRPTLRRDLNALVRHGHRRAYRIVVDEISGRFTRVTEQVWQSLQAGDADESVWRGADAAGWTRRRGQLRRATFNPMYVRLSLGSIDTVATKLVPFTGWLFSPLAVLFWSILISVASLLAIGRSTEVVRSLGSLQQFFLQTNPLSLGLIFIATKVVHELGHAVMCRRVGSRCGSVGVLLLCGMPCPYCDVTDLWRQASTIKRASVMLAGIYIELILAALATFTWLLATDPAIRFHALNLMVVCGISTLVFNANPLMRYDGYYVLCDLIGSTNLRQEARDAFRSVILKPIAGANYAIPNQFDVRSIGLATYHILSVAYRFVVLSAISALILVFADYLQLRQIAVAALLLAVVVLVRRSVKSVAAVAIGAGHWRSVPHWRRWGLVSGSSLLVCLVLFMPLPRYRTATGKIDVADAIHVYFPHDGVIEKVGFDFGDTVIAGVSLVQTRSDLLDYQHAKLHGQLRLASLRRNLSRRVTLGRTDTAQQWSTLEASEAAATTQLASVERRIEKSNVKSPVDGVVLPPESSVAAKEPQSLSLRRRIGTSADSYQRWCRISPDGEIHAVLILDARDRANIHVGSTVNISVSTSPGKIFSSTVDSVSAIHRETSSVTRQSEYQVLCRLPKVGTEEILRWMGTECQAVFPIPQRCLASDIGNWLGGWINGESS